MKKTVLALLSLLLSNLLFAQSGLKMVSEYSSKSEEIQDIMNFEGIAYYKLKFTGIELKGKSYKLTVKEILAGEKVSESVVVSSIESPVKRLETVNDTIFNIKVISKLTGDNKLKMTFWFPGFSMTKEYDAIETDDTYSLRNLVEESHLEIGYNKKFNLLAYILPYDKGNGIKSYCDVGTNGKDVENWGTKFGIKHYLLFEMEFQQK